MAEQTVAVAGDMLVCFDPVAKTGWLQSTTESQHEGMHEHAKYIFESLILAHAIAGIDVTSEAYSKSVLEVIDAYFEHYDLM